MYKKKVKNNQNAMWSNSNLVEKYIFVGNSRLMIINGKSSIDRYFIGKSVGYDEQIYIYNNK